MKGSVLDWAAIFFFSSLGESAFFLVLDSLTYLLSEIKPRSSLGSFASSLSVDIFVCPTCSVDCLLTYCLRQQDRNNIFPWSICITNVSPSMWINLRVLSICLSFCERLGWNCLVDAYVALMNGICPLAIFGAANQVKFSYEAVPLQLPTWRYQSTRPILVEKVSEWFVLVLEWPQN